MTQTLRLVSYNLLEGLRPIASPVGERRHFDRARVEAARAVVDGLRQDVLVLSSFLPGAQRARRRLLAPVRVPLSVFGAHDNAWGNAISSRSPILRSHQMRTEDRGGLVAVISVMMSELTVAAYHPNPNRDPADKAADFVRLVADLSGPMIVCGDFNCVSPEDVIDQASMIAAFRRFSREPEATVDQFIESGRQVFAALRRLGPKDALPPPGRRYSIPTDLISLDKSPGVRIDHVLANDALEIVASEVIHSVATNRASDHHPIMLDFRLRS